MLVSCFEIGVRSVLPPPATLLRLAQPAITHAFFTERKRLMSAHLSAQSGHHRPTPGMPCQPLHARTTAENHCPVPESAAVAATSELPPSIGSVAIASARWRQSLSLCCSNSAKYSLMHLCGCTAPPASISSTLTFFCFLCTAWPHHRLPVAPATRLRSRIRAMPVAFREVLHAQVSRDLRASTRSVLRLSGCDRLQHGRMRHLSPWRRRITNGRKFNPAKPALPP